MATVEIRGGEKLAQRLAELGAKLSSASQLRVGFLEGATYPGGTPVALVAAVQNYGAKGVPARPFFDQMVAENENGWPDLIALGLKRSKGDAAAALRFTGQIMVEQLQASIQSGNFAADSPITDLLKLRFPTGGQTFADVLQARRDVAAGATAPATKPLIWSNHMVNSAAAEVT